MQSAAKTKSPEHDEVLGREQRALKHAALLETILESMSEHVLVVDRAGAIVFGNKSQRAHAEDGPVVRTQEEWEQLVTLYTADGSRKLDFSEWPLSRGLRGETLTDFEFRSRGAGAPETVLLASCSPRIDESTGEPDGAIFILRNITAMRRTEAELRHSQKLETIGQLTGGIAHDFNNVLAAILSSAEVLQRGVASDAKLSQAAATVEKAALRGADLTRHLLAFARRQTLSPIAVDLAELIGEALMIIRPALGATIEINVAADSEVYAFADPAQITSALLNLCINARDAMAPTGGALRIEVRRRAGFAELSVRDTGCGMTPDVMAQAIEPFFTTKDVGKGSGLGLSMVYGFARQSGGDLRIESEVGVGTQITLILPQAVAPARSAPTPAKQSPNAVSRVLVVDDDALVREALCLQLRDAGFATIAASDGPSALGLIDQGAKFDVLLTDMVMPHGMSGLDLAEQVRERRPEARAILSTGYAEQELPEEGPNWRLLRKPYTASELFSALRTAMFLQR